MWKVQREATKIKTGANAAPVPVFHLRIQGSGIEEIRVSHCLADRGFWHVLAHDPMHRNGGRGRERSRTHLSISNGTCLSMFAFPVGSKEPKTPKWLFDGRELQL